MSNKYKINVDIIVRDEDKILFSANKMKIYKFNDRGFELIKLIFSKNEFDYKEMGKLAYEKLGMPSEEYEQFIAKMKDNDIIRKD